MQEIIPLGSAGAGPAMMNRLLKKFVRRGRLGVIYPNGSRFSFGRGFGGDPDVVIRLTKHIALWQIALHPDRYLGEAYMNGDLIIEKGDLWSFLDLCGRNTPLATTATEPAWLRASKAALRALQQSNTARAARRNVAHHYDLSPDLYREFLDRDLQYSCAYFRTPGETLEDAQRDKKSHIAAKLMLKPGQTILDIGCGWGGLALTLARIENVRVYGITLSSEQLNVARARAAKAGLADRVSFELRDYREMEGEFDRIVSVGMFEHVGSPQYSDFFRCLSRLLKPDGVALLHSIGRMHGPDVTSSWIRKYIFPGGYIPALSQVLPVIERTGLWLTDLEILRLHYASTLRAWRERFMAGMDQLDPRYDARFRRMWEFYLASSEMSFRHAGLMVFQAQLAKRVDAVPITRDYMFGNEVQIAPPLAAE
jgi:cyclopropane-fatty-acyl-phospholipid synthase